MRTDGLVDLGLVCRIVLPVRGPARPTVHQVRVPSSLFPLNSVNEQEAAEDLTQGGGTRGDGTRGGTSQILFLTARL